MLSSVAPLVEILELLQLLFKIVSFIKSSFVSVLCGDSIIPSVAWKKRNNPPGCSKSLWKTFLGATKNLRWIWAQRVNTKRPIYLCAIQKAFVTLLFEYSSGDDQRLEYIYDNIYED